MGGLLAYFATQARKPGLWLPVGMVFGGALGNLADRARIDGVTDFIDPAFWPAFNLADVAIVFGVLGVLYVAEGRR
jgi:signal peptidase II